MKNLKFSGLFLSLLLLMGSQAFALQCQSGRDIGGSADRCFTSAILASNETTLVSLGTVLVYDVSNAANTTAAGSFQVRVASASTNGVFVAGVSTQSYTSGSPVLIISRGIADVAVNNQDTITSGTAVWVGVSGNATVTTNTTQNQLGFVLENQTVSGGTPARVTKKVFITIV